MTFFIGVSYEMDYRDFTRDVVQYLANYDLKFYGGKDSISLSLIAPFIFALTPVGFHFTSSRIVSSERRLAHTFIQLVLILIFYFIYCFLDGVYIYNKIVPIEEVDGVVKFHKNDLHYTMIVLLTLTSTFMTGTIIKKVMTRD